MSTDALQGILHSQWITSETEESWRVEACTLFKLQKVFFFSSVLSSFLTFRKDRDNLFEHAVNVDAINLRSTPSRSSMFAQIAHERQEFRQALEPRDECCIMTASRNYTASHIIPDAHENAVSRHLKYHPNINSSLFSGLMSSLRAARLAMKMSPVLLLMMSGMAC